MRGGKRFFPTAKANPQSKKPRRTKRKSAKRQAIFKSSSWYAKAESSIGVASPR